VRTIGPGRAIASILLSAVVLAFVGAAYTLYFAAQTDVRLDVARNTTQYLARHGDVFALATIIGTMAGILTLVVIVMWHRIPLASQWPLEVRVAALAPWLLAEAALFSLAVVATPFIDGGGGRLFAQAYASATVPALQWIAFGLAVPVFEEQAVRGLLLPALAATRMGERWAVVATSLLWTSAHGGRGAISLVILFAFGLLLGMARLRSRSLTPPLAMHVAWNAGLYALQFAGR
jgi:CAAX protease family protein